MLSVLLRSGHGGGRALLLRHGGLGGDGRAAGSAAGARRSLARHVGCEGGGRTKEMCELWCCKGCWVRWEEEARMRRAAMRRMWKMGEWRFGISMSRVRRRANQRRGIGPWWRACHVFADAAKTRFQNVWGTYLLLLTHPTV